MKWNSAVATVVANSLLFVLCVMGAILLARKWPGSVQVCVSERPQDTTASAERLYVAADRLGKEVDRFLSALGGGGAFENKDFRTLLADEPRRDAIRALWSDDVSERELLRKFTFRGYRSIIEELGLPDRMFSSESGAYFRFFRDPQDDLRYLELVFLDGIVISVQRT